jgi:hypothetical protein
MSHGRLQTGILAIALLIPVETAVAGGVTGRIYNLPDERTGEVSPIIDDSVTFRVTVFNTDSSIQVMDVKGNVIAPVTRDGQVPVPPNQEGCQFAFTIARSASRDGKQAVDIQFFRRGERISDLTQILKAVIIDDNRIADNVDVSVPLPEQMGKVQCPNQPYMCAVPPCQSRCGLFHRGSRR